MKLGRGGIREVEFVVQALQMHAAARPLAAPGEHDAGAAPALGARLDRIRGICGAWPTPMPTSATSSTGWGSGENHWTSLLPADPEALEKLARTLSLAAKQEVDDTPTLSSDLERHRSIVRRFYDSVIGEAAQLAMQEETGDLLLDRLAEGELLRRLRQAGFPDAESLVRPVQGLRRLLQPAALIPKRSHALRRAGPALLQASLHAANPRRALAHLETLFSVLLAEPDGLPAVLWSTGELLAQTITMFGRSDLVARLLSGSRMFFRRSRIAPCWCAHRVPEEPRALLLEAAHRHGTMHDRAGELRRRHQSLLAAIAIRDINRQATVRESIRSLSSLADPPPSRRRWSWRTRKSTAEIASGSRSRSSAWAPRIPRDRLRLRPRPAVRARSRGRRLRLPPGQAPRRSVKRWFASSPL